MVTYEAMTLHIVDEIQIANNYVLGALEIGAHRVRIGHYPVIIKSIAFTLEVNASIDSTTEILFA